MKTKALLLSLVLFATDTVMVADGHRYYAYTVAASHQPIYTTAEFESVNIKIQGSLLQDDLVLRVEVFVIPAGPGYKVLIGEKGANEAVFPKERDYILSEVRRLFIEARQETQSKGHEKKPHSERSDSP